MKKSLLMLVAVLAFIGAGLPSVMAADGSESIVVRVKFRILDLKKDWVAKMPVTVGAIRLKWLDKIPIGTQALIKRITAEVVNIVSYESKPSEVVSQFVMRNAKQIDFAVRPVTYNIGPPPPLALAPSGSAQQVRAESAGWSVPVRKLVSLAKKTQKPF